jgi:uncharacterized protein YbbC (DUF1343 family)
MHKTLLFLCLLFLPLAPLPAKVMLGIDVLREGGFAPLNGLRVGLLTNQAGVDSDGVSTISILHEAKSVNLVALFGPEHGIYGTAKANDPVDDQTDPATGLPVYSLYGKYRTPTDAMLEGIDIMVIDLQDIGVRSYTYISCMRLTMQACFRKGVKVLILDRPNPLGGEKVDGPPLELDLRSYVGAFPVPYVHGLTIGELARIAKLTDDWLDLPEDIRTQGDLSIIPMKGWTRSMTWDQTGLEWIPTSPGIPNLGAVLGYAMTGLGCEINRFRHGFGTPFSFRLLTFPGIEPDALIAHLNDLKVPGVQFVKATTTDARDNPITGAYVQVFNWNILRPTALSFYLMPLACRLQGENPYATASANSRDLFNKHVGSHNWWAEISTKGEQADVKTFLQRWQARADKFKIWSSNYWIYP